MVCLFDARFYIQVQYAMLQVSFFSVGPRKTTKVKCIPQPRIFQRLVPRNDWPWSLQWLPRGSQRLPQSEQELRFNCTGVGSPPNFFMSQKTSSHQNLLACWDFKKCIWGKDKQYRKFAKDEKKNRKNSLSRKDAAVEICCRNKSLMIVCEDNDNTFRFLISKFSEDLSTPSTFYTFSQSCSFPRWATMHFLQKSYKILLQTHSCKIFQGNPFLA